MAGLTTHVLDTVNGRPAADVEIELFEHEAGRLRVSIAKARTNKDGRTDSPLIAAKDARAGRFELEFHIGDYFRSVGRGDGEPRFSRGRAHSLQHSGAERALSRAARRHALELFDLSRQLNGDEPATDLRP